jgi:hypothetical protein
MDWMDLSALYDETASEDEVIAAYQYVIDTGLAWVLEGHVGRCASAMIEAEICRPPLDSAAPCGMM